MTETKSNTPETDAKSELSRNRYGLPDMVDTDFARKLERERDELKRGSTENCFEWQDWERWAKEVCEDFRIPFDNHKAGIRMAITQWMADRLTK